MGAYVNPTTGETKEEFLKREGEVIDEPVFFEISEGKLAVCLVDNGPFTAAGIVYNDRELEAFTDKGDGRPKTWYSVDMDKLYTVSPELKEYI